MSDQLLEELEKVVALGTEQHVLGIETRNTMNNVIVQLRGMRDMGMPAFAIAPVPENCPACGQKIRSSNQKREE